MKEYQIAFVGNPNVGKSAWINALSDANLKVGNWPGVTIEKKEAMVSWGKNIYHLIDLPGTYALDISTNEEHITSQYLKHEPVDLIVNVLDATNLTRNLYLTLLLRELQIPMIVILNFMDEVEKYNIFIDCSKLSRRLQLPILPYSVLDKKHTYVVKEAICEFVTRDVCYAPIIDGMLANQYARLATFIEMRCPTFTKAQTHTFLHSLLHQEPLAYKQLEHWGITKEEISPYTIDWEDYQSAYQSAITSFMKYVQQEEGIRLKTSRRIDYYMLHKYLGFPIFFFLFSILLMIVFNSSAPFNNYIDFLINDMFVKYISAMLSFLPDVVQQCILHGIVAGVGGVLTFVPLMAFLYFMLSILEETGYMSRIAFLFDRSMRVFHLSGKSFVSLLLGFGCNVPAIYATRTLDNEKQKKLTALIVPFMSCGARLPVYVLFASAFFQGKAAIMILTIYGIGILLAMILALLFSKINHFKDQTLFVLELPPYRIPAMSVVFQKVKQEVVAYVRKATTIVLWAMILLWGLTYFPNGTISDSYLAKFGQFTAPLYEPLGFGTRWETISALPGSIIAKETVVGFLSQVLIGEEQKEISPINVKEDLKIIAYEFGAACKESVVSIFPKQVIEEGNTTLITSIQGLWNDQYANLRAFSFMVYVLLSIPCVMTLQVIYREYGLKLLGLNMLTMLVVPYIVAFFIFQFFSFLL